MAPINDGYFPYLSDIFLPSTNPKLVMVALIIQNINDERMILSDK